MSKNSVWLNILIIFITPWWWKIITTNIFLGILLLITSVLFYTVYFQKRNGKFSYLLLGLNLIVIIILLTTAFDKKIFINSQEDIQQYHKRHEFLANGLKKFYTNRFVLFYYERVDTPLYKTTQNFFSNLDLNLYFFGSHPRERLGIDEFEKYQMFLLPFFLIGIITIIHKGSKNIFYYIIFITILSSFISSRYNLGPILFFPVINSFITTGVIMLIRIKNLNKLGK